MAFVDDVKDKAQLYLTEVDDMADITPSTMVIDFAIEKFCQKRNYPSNYTEEKILADMKKHLSTIAMAVVDIYMKSGAEGEVMHDENGIRRTYENAYISDSLFADVLPFVKII